MAKVFLSNKTIGSRDYYCNSLDERMHLVAKEIEDAIDTVRVFVKFSKKLGMIHIEFDISEEINFADDGIEEFIEIIMEDLISGF
jgi:uncharacterized protein YlaN (UPF0358 family)